MGWNGFRCDGEDASGLEDARGEGWGGCSWHMNPALKRVFALKIKASEERGRQLLIKKTLAERLPFICEDCRAKGEYAIVTRNRKPGWREQRIRVHGLECSHNDGNAFNNDPGNLKWRCRDCHASHDALLRRLPPT